MIILAKIPFNGIIIERQLLYIITINYELLAARIIKKYPKYGKCLVLRFHFCEIAKRFETRTYYEVTILSVKSLPLVIDRSSKD